MKSTPRGRLRRLAPLAVLLVPVLLIAAVAAVDAFRHGRGDRDTVALFPGSAPAGPPGVTRPLPAATAPPAAGAPTTAPACPASGLSVRPGLPEAAMGLRVLGIVVVNCGTVPRAVRGHPAVRVLDAERRPLDVLVGRGSSGIATVARFDAPPVTVTLEPGERAASAVLWRSLVTDPSRVALGHYLEVPVSAGDPPQVIAPEGGLDLGNTGKLGVAPWAPMP